MDWVSGIVSFILIWWLMLFTVLPFSLKRDETGKPEDPRLGRKALMTTGVACLVWLGLYGLVGSDIVSFRDIAARMK